MSNFLNCWQILSDVRIGINEWSLALTNGTDTTGVFANEYLIKKINESQQFIWNSLFTDVPEYFLKSATFTFTASVGTLPTDCHKIKRLEDSDGHQIDSISVDVRAKNTSDGSPHQYFRYGNTIKLDGEQSGTYTLWYYAKCRDITTGTSSAGGAKSITLATTARKEANYYDLMQLENVTADWVDTVSAYSTSRVCTLLAETAAASQYYGFLSTLPENFHPLIAERTVIVMKQSPLAVLKLTSEDINIFNMNFDEAKKSFAGQAAGDVDIASIFCDF